VSARPSDSDETLTADEGDEKSDRHTEILSCSLPNIRRCDIDTLANTNECLNDTIINAAQTLLHRQFPSAGGLHDTVAIAAGDIALTASPEGNVIQIVHDPRSQHWLVVTSQRC
jgi:hypothetical protein